VTFCLPYMLKHGSHPFMLAGTFVVIETYDYICLAFNVFQN
jgi:hypothetical protein